MDTSFTPRTEKNMSILHVPGPLFSYQLIKINFISPKHKGQERIYFLVTYCLCVYP